MGRESGDFPKLLKESDLRVERLFVRGNVECLSSPSIAIVGTRKATTVGLKIAEEIGYELGKCGFTIVSGLALGIDAAAHKGALRAQEENGRTKTIAVLGNGVVKIYPAQNEGLAQEIIESGGAIVSEVKSGPSRHQGIFLERNRIIAGLSIATIVVEAPYQSGSINTAGWAGKQGKPVFVVPGPINNPNYDGSHKLIRDGATLVASYKDVLEDLGIEIKKPEIAEISFENKTEKLIFGVLKEAGEPLNVDTLVEETGLPTSDVNTSLTMLVLRKIISETAEGFTI